MKHDVSAQATPQKTPWLHRQWKKICILLAVVYLLLLAFSPLAPTQIRAGGMYVMLLLVLYLFVFDPDPWFTKGTKGKSYTLGWWTGRNFLPKLKFASFVLIGVCLIDLLHLPLLGVLIGAIGYLLITRGKV